MVTGCGTWWCTGHARFEGRDRHASAPVAVGERHAWLIQDEGRKPHLLITLVPHSTVTVVLTVDEAEVVGIDVEKLWPGL